MHGVDWKKKAKRYAKLVDRITTRHELNDVLGQLFGDFVPATPIFLAATLNAARTSASASWALM